MKSVADPAGATSSGKLVEQHEIIHCRHHSTKGWNHKRLMGQAQHGKMIHEGRVTYKAESR